MQLIGKRWLSRMLGAMAAARFICTDIPGRSLISGFGACGDGIVLTILPHFLYRGFVPQRIRAGPSGMVLACRWSAPRNLLIKWYDNSA